MNFIAAKVVSRSASTVTLRAEGLSEDLTLRVTEGSAAPGETVTIGIRPEAFSDDLSGVTVTGRIAVIESLGRETLLYLDAGTLRAFDSESHEGHFAVHRTRQIAAAHGDPLTLGVDPRAVYLFDAQDRAIVWPSIHA
jgi:multiple sugar transport system ATP-binding protein